MANINISQILMKRGNTAAASTYIGPLGELLVDTGLKTLRVQDGVTAGGMAILPTLSMVSNITSNLSAELNSVSSNLASAVSTINNNISAITGFDSNVVANLSALLSDASIQQTTINNIEANVLSLQNNPVYANANVASYLPIYGGNIALSNVLNNSHVWTFGTDGSMTIPGVINMPNTGWLDFNGGDTNWRIGYNLGGYSKTTAQTTLDIEIGQGTAGPDGFTVGQSGGASIFELTGYNQNAWFANNVTVGGNIFAGDGSAIQFSKNYEHDNPGYHIQGDTIGFVANTAYPAVSWNIVTNPLVDDHMGNVLYAQNTLTAPYSDSANVGLLQFGGPSGTGTIWWEGGAYSGNTQPYLNSLNLNSTANVVVSTNNEGYNWTFSNIGELTLPNGGHLGPVGKGWTGLDGGAGNPVSLLSYYNDGMYSGCFTITPGNGAVISTYGDGTGQTGQWTFDNTGNLTIGGNLIFADSTVQTTAAVNPDSDWTNPNNNTWHIRTYNGGYSFTYAQGASPTVWWDAANSPLGGLNQFRGAVIEYHAYISGNTNGTVVGSIIVAQDGTTNIEATHTENIDLFNNASTVNFWSRPSYTQLGYSNSGLTVSGQQDNVMIMWTARVFYGAENAC